MNGRSTGSFIRHNNSNISNKSIDTKIDSARDSQATQSIQHRTHYYRKCLGHEVRESLVKGNKGSFLGVEKEERLLSRTCSLQQ